MKSAESLENKIFCILNTYSAKENDQNEVQRIRQKYLPQEEDKMEKLRRLDRSVAQKAQITALTIGLVGTIFLGFGMSLAMTPLSEIWGSHRSLSTEQGNDHVGHERLIRFVRFGSPINNSQTFL